MRRSQIGCRFHNYCQQNIFQETVDAPQASIVQPSKQNLNFLQTNYWLFSVNLLCLKKIIKSYPMDQIESYDLSLLIKELRLSVKFPCRLTLQHGGRPISPQIASNGSSVFALNREVSIKEEKNKDYLEINVNLATDKGGNIMAGIIKINLRDISSSEGENLTISLQKCLDPYATCLLTVKSVKINRSRVKKAIFNQDLKPKHLNELKFESKSEAPVLDIRSFKPKPRYNQAEALGSKKILNSLHSPMNSQLKEKALSMVGFRGVNASFDREDLASRHKNFGKREDEDNKTVITNKWKESQHVVKASIQANEKNLKLQILKYKTKFEESERNIQEKGKQIKNLKDQIADLNRQLTEKQYLVEELTTKNHQISKLQEANKSLSRQIHEEKAKIIDLQRQIQEEKNSSYMQMSRYKQQHDKKEHDLQKGIQEKKEEIKEIMEENMYKNNQINKMKALIEDLEANLESKTYQYEKMYSRQKNQHNKTKTALQQRITDLQAEIKKYQQKQHSLSETLKKSEEENAKLSNKIVYLEESLLESETKIEEEQIARNKLIDEKKLHQKIQEQLKVKIKSLQKDANSKEKDLQSLTLQLSELSSGSKKKISELMEKNKSSSVRIQELENKVNVLTAQEEKLKRNLEMNQKELKGIQQSQKIAVKNSKLKDERILQLEKELTEIENKNSMKENLSKKQAEYKTIQLEKMTTRVSELERSFEKEKETAQQRRLELLKNENKVRMLEESTHRLNEQIKEIKVNHIKKEDELTEKIRELKADLKMYEEKIQESNKELHMAQIEKINLKNQIAKLEKTVETLHDKVNRLKKRQSQLQATLKDLNSELILKNEEILDQQASYKALQNDYKTLQADKSKTQKITTIITEEKVMAVSDINKLKKELERREQKEEEYQTQLKQLKEEIVKLQLKLNTTSKDFQKFRSTLSESIKNSLSIKNSFASLDTASSGLDLSRMNRSRIKTIMDYSITLESSESKFAEMIDNYARQSQQALSMLNEELKKTKKDRDALEKEVQSLNLKLREAEQEFEKKISEVTAEIEIMSSQNAVEMEQYEDKVFSLEKQLAKKEKSINELNIQIDQLKIIHSNEMTTQQITISDLVSKITSLKGKVSDYQMKDQSNTVMFVTLQQKIAVLQAENTELIRQNEVLTDQLSKKQKQTQRKTEDHEDLVLELEGVKKAKSDLLGQLLTAKESLTIEKENNKRYAADLKEQETKNVQFRLFNAELLKEKELAIKREAELTEQINSHEQSIQTYMIQIAEKTEQIAKANKAAAELKEECRILRMETNNNQSTISDMRLDLQREKEKVKDKDRKLSEKDQDIEDLHSQIKKNTCKYQTQLATLTQEIQQLTETIRKKQSQFSFKCNEFEFTIRNLKENQHKINQANTSLEEQIFFEKQMNSINSGKIDELHHEITNLHIQIDQLKNNISSLNEQLREKQQSLFALSGKLFTSENRLQSREDEFRSRLEKVELEWRYKIEEICEQYENKIEIMEREKSYVKSGMEGYSETVQKLENQKATLRQQLDRQRQIWDSKLKKAQQEKLISLIEKNRQIEKIREVFQELEEKLKRRDLDIKALQDEKKKAEEKFRQLRTEVEKSDEKHNEAVHHLEREVDQLKRKEGQLKRFKEALKNSQWATEREIKKSIQSCSKTVINLVVEQSKQEAMSLMRNLQISVAKMALPNIDQM